MVVFGSYMKFKCERQDAETPRKRRKIVSSAFLRVLAPWRSSLHYFASCCTPRGVKSTGGNFSYVRLPVLTFTSSGVGVLMVTTHWTSRVAATLRTSSSFTALIR